MQIHRAIASTSVRSEILHQPACAVLHVWPVPHSERSCKLVRSGSLRGQNRSCYVPNWSIFTTFDQDQSGAIWDANPAWTRGAAYLKQLGSYVKQAGDTEGCVNVALKKTNKGETHTLGAQMQNISVQRFDRQAVFIRCLQSWCGLISLVNNRQAVFIRV